MNIVAICAESFAVATTAVVKVKPLSSPPLFDSSFDPALIGNPDLLYIHLHGLPNDPALIGDLGVAVTAEQLRSCNLKGTIVLVLSCFVGTIGHPVLEALLDAGARYVVAAPGENYAGKSTVIGADVLAREFITWLDMKVVCKVALRLAKLRVRSEVDMHHLQMAFANDDSRDLIEANMNALIDTLGFVVFTREAQVGQSKSATTVVEG